MTEYHKLMNQRSLVLVVIGIAAAALLALLGIFAFVQKMIRGNETYLLAMARLNDCEPCLLALGEPVSTGLLISGDITYSGDGGHSSLSIPLQGSAAAGTLHAQGMRANGEWSLVALTLDSRDGLINVLTANDGRP